MMCVHGDAGLGKTLSVNASLRALAPADTCRVQFRARPAPRDIRHVLFDALGISGTPPTRPIEFDALLKDALSERFRVLVCDEAQWLSRECLELWRHLRDDRRTDIAIVFAGGGDCYRVLRREPMLSSRVYVWQEFRRLDREQVLAVIPAYHPVWASADPADIAFACPSFRPHFAMKRPGGPPKCFLLLFEPFDRCAQPLVDNANERRQHARDTPQPATARLEG